MLSQRLIPLLVLCLLAAGCDGSGGSTITPHGRMTMLSGSVVLWTDQAPKALIDKNGELSIDGKAIAVDDSQRELLRRYYASASAMRQHGFETGKAGAAMAGEAIKGVVESIDSDKDTVDQRVEAQTKRIEAAAQKICDDLADVKAAQDKLAASLPAFKPYAGIMDEASVKDCYDDKKTTRE